MANEPPRCPRPVWGPVFLVAGIVAMLSGVLLLFGVALALPWVVVSWSLTALAGYRIWRANNPGIDARREVARRGRAIVTGAAGVGLVVLALAFPDAILIVVGVWLIAIVLLFGALAWGTRGGGAGIEDDRAPDHPA